MPAKVNRVLKYTAPDGTEFDTLDAEKGHELLAVVGSIGSLTEAEIVKLLVEKGDAIVAILRQKERKHASPKAKKVGRPAGSKNKPATPEPTAP
jgi:hypothetical protein